MPAITNTSMYPTVGLFRDVPGIRNRAMVFLSSVGGRLPGGRMPKLPRPWVMCAAAEPRSEGCRRCGGIGYILGLWIMEKKMETTRDYIGVI